MRWPNMRLELAGAVVPTKGRVLILVTALITACGHPLTQGALTSEPVPPLVLEPDKYSYTFGVPVGWRYTFDIPDEPRANGVRLLYLPAGGDYDTSTSIVYVTEPCSAEYWGVLTACIDTVIAESREGNPRLQVDRASPIPTAGGDTAQVRLLSGSSDPRQAREALAFVDHHQVVVLIVLTTKNVSRWRRDYAAFERIVAGHRYFDCNSAHLAVPCAR